MRKASVTKKYFAFPPPHTADTPLRCTFSAMAAVGLLLFVLCPLTPHTLSDTASTSEPSAAVQGAAADAASAVFLMQGDRGEEVLSLQRALCSLGYETVCSGVFTHATAKAVRALQNDLGMTQDGVVTSAVSHALESLCGGTAAVTTHREQLIAALAAAGCLSPEEEIDGGTLRDALMLFQRTHGLCGTGSTNFATLCALGLTPAADRSDTLSQVNAALSDLHCRQIAEALAAFVLRHPEAKTLYVLRACAAVLCTRLTDPTFPDTLQAVCAQGLSDTAEVDDRPYTRAQIEALASDPLLLCAAEGALEAYDGGTLYDIARGARYVVSRYERVPQSAVICMETAAFVFYK